MTFLPASRRLGASALVLLLLTGCGGTAASSDAAPPSNASSTVTSDAAELRGERAVVERVIDGDTVDVQLGGEVVRVRRLNIDTPETKDPNEVVECLGPEATALLEELLPPGTVVGLEYDQERTDSYGRRLAGVFLEDGTLVNAEIARQGLGTPLYIAPNDRFLPPVEEAFAEAEQQQAGLLDPAHGCTIPAQLQQATNALADAAPADLDDVAGEVAAALA
ncbi:thermonuclease family protein, partial [Kocuria oceani]